MVYVSKGQLQQVEYLIHQSIQGNHVLFDTDTIRRVFENKTMGQPFNVEKAYAVEPHIERLILFPTLWQKRAYLKKLDKETLEQVIRAYFNIIENNLHESLRVKH